MKRSPFAWLNANEWGQLGTGSDSLGADWTPQPVTDALVTSISAGGEPDWGSGACGVWTDPRERVKCRGRTPALAVDSQGTRAPSKVPFPVRVGSIAVGGTHACGLAGNGDVWCWGQRGLAPRVPAISHLGPVPVPFRPRSVAVGRSPPYLRRATRWIDGVLGRARLWGPWELPDRRLRVAWTCAPTGGLVSPGSARLDSTTADCTFGKMPTLRHPPIL